MILQRIRIIVEDAAFEPGTFALMSHHIYLSLWEWKGGSQDARKVVKVGRYKIHVLYILVYVCK